MTPVLYINDNNLELHKDGDVSRSQGYVWLKKQNIYFGNDSSYSPIEHCRLAPQEINSRYWQQCDKSSVASNDAGMRHAADLIWKHLGELKQHHNLSDLILVVPSHYQSSNLQLLLGVTKSVGINVTALVNKPILSLYNQISDDGEYCHLDVQLHQTVSSRIVVSNGVAKLHDVETIQTVGIQAMQDALLKALQTHFIQNDRFDPLHSAETEQQLFNQLQNIFDQVAESAKANIVLQHRDQQHSSSVDNKFLNQVIGPFVNLLTESSKNAKHCFIELNGAFNDKIFSSLFSEDVSIIGHGKLDKKFDHSSMQSDDGSLLYLTELAIANHQPLNSSDNGNESQSLETTPTGATHLLQSGVAIPIEHSELRLDNNQLSLHAAADGNVERLLKDNKLFIMNEESRRQLQLNDRIGSQFADGVITVIQVV